MRGQTTILAITALFASFAQGQTELPTQERVFKLAYIPAGQQMQEVATMIRSIADIGRLTTDENQRTITVQGTADQIGVMSWFLNELDRPGAQKTPPLGSQPVLEYRMQGGGDDVVRMFYLPYAQSVQELQEIATTARSIVNSRRMFTYNGPRVVAMRGPDDQIAAAAWLFEQLGQTANPNATAPRYQMPGGNDDIMTVYHVRHAATVRDFQEVVTTVRSVAGIPRMFTYNGPRLVAARATSAQLKLADWMMQQLDSASPRAAASEPYRIAGENENVVRVFYMPQTTPDEFHKRVIMVRTTTGARRAFTCNAIRAVALRGTETQIDQAAQLIANESKPKS